MEEIKVADTARYVSFYAYDSADHISPADGITGFTVYYYLNNGSVTAMTTPTVTEKDSTNAKGWYTLLVDEAGMVSAEGVTSINIEATGMDPVAIKVKIVGNTTKEVYDRVGAPVGASISADLVVIDNFVDDLESRLTAARAGYLDELAAANLPTDIADIPTVAEFEARTLPTADYVVTTDTIAGVTTATNLTNAPTSGDLTATMKTSVNDQVVDVIRTDTTAEMSQGAPPAAPTFEEMVAYLYFKMRNKQTTTVSEDAIFNNAGDTKLFKSTISDNGTTFTKQEYGTGA